MSKIPSDSNILWLFSNPSFVISSSSYISLSISKSACICANFSLISFSLFMSIHPLLLLQFLSFNKLREVLCHLGLAFIRLPPLSFRPYHSPLKVLCFFEHLGFRSSLLLLTCLYYMSFLMTRQHINVIFANFVKTAQNF